MMNTRGSADDDVEAARVYHHLRTSRLCQCLTYSVFGIRGIRHSGYGIGIRDQHSGYGIGIRDQDSGYGIGIRVRYSGYGMRRPCSEG